MRPYSPTSNKGRIVSVDPDFNFNLKEMEEALASPQIQIPPEIVDFEFFQKWLETFDKGE